MKIEHFALNVPDPRAMADWYVAHLGMTIIRSGGAPKYVRFLADASGMQIELYDNTSEPYFDLAGTASFTFHLAMAVTEIEAERNRLIGAGAVPVGEVTVSAEGDRLAFLRDPFSLTLQLAQRA